jgi:hypothetical protein
MVNPQFIIIPFGILGRKIQNEKEANDPKEDRK